MLARICRSTGTQCENLVIFLPLRFYVKSIFGDFGVSKSAILTVLAPPNLAIGELLQFVNAEIC